MRIAVILTNLGGPDSLQAVEPFLFNLFSDSAILNLPNPFRFLLAKWIAKRRAKKARDIYAAMGGASPILANTVAQKNALEKVLQQHAQGPETFKVFLAMRYWHPLPATAISEVKEFHPDAALVLPLYPQYSTTTTASAYRALQAAAIRQAMKVPLRQLCCYPDMPGLILAMANEVRATLHTEPYSGPHRFLFSAHGLPKKVIAKGDPYQSHVEMTAAALAAALDLEPSSWRVCYQSRVGPLEWIGPSTEEEIRKAGQEGIAVTIVPVAFVSEHSETLVELDQEYRNLAKAAGVPCYRRVSTVGTEAAFIQGLAEIVRSRLENRSMIQSSRGQRICAAACQKCPHPAYL